MKAAERRGCSARKNIIFFQYLRTCARICCWIGNAVSANCTFCTANPQSSTADHFLRHILTIMTINAVTGYRSLMLRPRASCAKMFPALAMFGVVTKDSRPAGTQWISLSVCVGFVGYSRVSLKRTTSNVAHPGTESRRTRR